MSTNQSYEMTSHVQGLPQYVGDIAGRSRTAWRDKASASLLGYWETYNSLPAGKRTMVAAGAGAAAACFVVAPATLWAGYAAGKSVSQTCTAARATTSGHSSPWDTDTMSRDATSALTENLKSAPIPDTPTSILVTPTSTGELSITDIDPALLSSLAGPTGESIFSPTQTDTSAQGDTATTEAGDGPGGRHGPPFGAVGHPPWKGEISQTSMDIGDILKSIPGGPSIPYGSPYMILTSPSTATSTA